MNKILKLMVAVTLVISSVVGCGGVSQAKSEEVANNTQGSISEEKDKNKKIKAVLIVRTALGDKSFYDSAWAGLQRAQQELNIDVNAIEIGGDQSKYKPTIIDASESDADIIFVNSGALSEVAEEVVEQYPDKKYVFYDMQPTFENVYDNVVAISFKQNESSFVAGVVGALMSESKVMGFVGGIENTIINDFMVGYINGAKYADPNIKIHTALIGNMTDTAKGKELALVQINNKADVIHGVAGAAGLGVLDAVKERGTWGLGVDSDQAMKLKDTAPETSERILTSALKQVDLGLFSILQEYYAKEGEIEWGTMKQMGIREEVAGIAKNEYYMKNVPDEIKEVVEEVEKKIVTGEIFVPTSFDMDQNALNELKNSVKP